MKEQNYNIENLGDSYYLFRKDNKHMINNIKMFALKYREKIAVDLGLSEEFRADKEIVLTAVKKCGYALKYASEELRNDREVVLEAFKRHNEALEYASRELQEEFYQKIQQFIDNLK